MPRVHSAAPQGACLIIGTRSFQVFSIPGGHEGAVCVVVAVEAVDVSIGAMIGSRQNSTICKGLFTIGSSAFLAWQTDLQDLQHLASPLLKSPDHRSAGTG